MPKITSVKGRILYNSRGSKTIEIDVVSDNSYLGRVCAPSGASIGKHEATSFPENKPEKSLEVLNANSKKFLGRDPSDLKSIHNTIREIDDTPDYSKIGGAVAFALTISSADSASNAQDIPLFRLLTNEKDLRF